VLKAKPLILSIITSPKEVTLTFEFYKESYTGGIKDITLGEGSRAVTVGGETCYPFYQFEGSMPNKPKIAMEIWDMEPEDWPERKTGLNQL
jgi:acetyl-CoA decarbonylase/synthase complex subunit delta